MGYGTQYSLWCFRQKTTTKAVWEKENMVISYHQGGEGRGEGEGEGEGEGVKTDHPPSKQCNPPLNPPPRPHGQN